MIVLADVVANDCSDIASAVLGSLRTFVTDQQKPAFIVVAIVVLNDRVAAIPVGIKAFSVVLTASSIDFVVLDDGVVPAPRPNTNVIVLRTLTGISNDVVFDQSTLGRDVHNAVSTNVVKRVVADDYAQAGIPLRPHPMRRPTKNTAAVHM